MLFSASERILLLNILPPAEGNALLLRSVRSLRKALAFSAAEIHDWEILNPAPCVFTWNDAAVPVEIDVPPPAYGYLKAHLIAAEKSGTLHEHLLDVFDRFIPAPGGIDELAI